MASSFFPIFAGGDLQNIQKRNRQSILAFLFLFSYLHLFRVFLWVSSSSPLIRVAIIMEEAWDPVASLQAVLQCLRCSRRLVGER